MNKTNKVIACAICFLAFVCVGYILMQPSVSHTMSLKNTDIDYKSETVEVTINGEVKNEGIYSVNIGMTYYDALFLAGGITDDADISSLDMERIISSPCIITVLKRDKNAVSAQAQYEIMSDAESHKLNINHATAKQLTELEGIGETLANRIVEYREQNGDFKSIEELLEIKGIGKGKYDKFKSYITIGVE